MSWYEQIENNVLSYVKAMLTMKGYSPHVTSLLDKTAVDDDGNPRMFPTVYIHALQSVEIGNDLNNTDVNAVSSTVEIQVFSRSYSECKALRSEILDIMKSLRFNAPMLPITTKPGDYYWDVARYTRIIGSGDLDLITQE